MAVITFCDRCGTEIEGPDAIRIGYGRNLVDLCGAGCARALVDDLSNRNS